MGLIRGINVGKSKRVPMADLRALVADLGFGDVRTLLNSGNVVFTAPGTPPNEAASRIEASLRERTGVSARVLVLTAEEIDEAVAGNPWAEEIDEPSRLLVTILNDPVDLAKLKPFAAQTWETERLALGGRVAYLWCPSGVLESKLPDLMAKTLRDGATTRNWATMLKLQALMHSAAT